MRFVADALSVRLLEHLAKVGEIPRKTLYTAFSETYNYRYYARTVKRLIDEGYIDTGKRNSMVHVRLSQKGEHALTSMFDGKEETPQIAQHPTNRQEQNRMVLVADVIALCKANGFRTDEDEKPLLRDLYQIPVSASIREEFVDAVNDGVYYSSRELRSAYMDVMGNNEIANWTRLIGILLYKGTLSFLYSTGGKLIKWMPTNEDRTVKFITAFLSQSDIISDTITFYPYPSCIICGKGYTMIPKIVMGRRWGRIEPDDKFIERSRAHIAKNHINSHNLAKVFCAAYYVSADASGTRNFRLASVLSEAKKNQICNDWFRKNSEYAMRSQSRKFYQGITVAKHEGVVFMPYIDLIELEYYKKQGDPCHFIIPKGTQDAVSRVMGPLLLSAQTVNHETLQYKKYDQYGAAINIKKEGGQNDSPEDM